MLKGSYLSKLRLVKTFFSIGLIAYFSGCGERKEINNEISWERLFPMPKGDRWGYITESGRFAIEPQFLAAQPFSEGLAAVKHKKGFGFIDSGGNFQIEPTLLAAHNGFSGGFARVRTAENEDVFINKDGKTEFLIKEEWVDSAFSEGLVGFANYTNDPNVYGFLDESGQIVIPPMSEWSRRFSEGKAVVKIGGKCGFIDREGNIVIPPLYDDTEAFSEGLARVWNNQKVGYLDHSGDFHIPPRFQGGYSFSEGLAFIIDEDRQGGYINQLGELKISGLPNSTGNTFSGGVVLLNSGHIFGDSKPLVLDKNGKRLPIELPPNSSTFNYHVGRFEKGLAQILQMRQEDSNPNSSRVIPTRTVGYVNAKGKIVRLDQKSLD